MSRWRAPAEETIGTVIRAGFVAGISVAAIRRKVDEAYPFGPRQYHPYKVWLDVRREMFAIHGLRTAAEKARDAKRAAPASSTRRKRTPADFDGARADGLIR